MRAGDLVVVDFGMPQGSEPGFVRPAVVVVADHVLQAEPRTLHVVPLTTNRHRRLPTEVLLGSDLPVEQVSTAQVHLCTVVSRTRLVGEVLGNVGPVNLAQIRAVLGDLLDIG